ncbi:phage holin family protein [Candidatus Parcubacteria bacterium]|nr:phage holin family protein [Candidatus Parcubacteria bacterium]
MKTILKIAVVALAIMALPRFIPGIAVSGFLYALLAALALGLVNLLIKPLVSLLALPVNMLTLGLFGLVVNALLLWLVALYVPGFEVATFTAAFLGALVIAVVNWLISRF